MRVMINVTGRSAFLWTHPMGRVQKCELPKPWFLLVALLLGMLSTHSIIKLVKIDAEASTRISSLESFIKDLSKSVRCEGATRSSRPLPNYPAEENESRIQVQRLPLF